MNHTMMRSIVANAVTLRRELFHQLLDEQNRDLDFECGYPDQIDAAQYRKMYDRICIAKRVVVCLPEESWTAAPAIYETEDSNETEFEKIWTELEDTKFISHYWQRIDELSGIGRFGILLLGINDGKGLDEAVDGINAAGEKTGAANYELLYLRAFDESVVEIASREMDATNPRYGQPVTYKVTFEESQAASGVTSQNIRVVHWSRVIHIADGRKMSEVYGTPRMKIVYNRLLDIRKVLSSSGEMFWRGAFPGLFLGVDKDIAAAGYTFSTDEMDEVKDHVEDYMNGLQRYMALSGMDAKMLAPTVTDPTPHLEANLNAIAIALSVPKRILFGSEQAELASTQDKTTWAKRMMRRQDMYLEPMIIRPTIDRFIALGILPEPKEYTVDFPDLYAPSDLDKAELGKARMEAIAKYVQSGADQLISPRQFFTTILGLSVEEAEAIVTEMEKMLKEEELAAEADRELIDEAELAGSDNEDGNDADDEKGIEDDNEDPDEVE